MSANFTGVVAEELARTADRDDTPSDGGNPAILDAIDVVVFVASRDGSFTYLNANWERLSGFAIAQTVGVSLMEYVHPRDRAALLQYLDDPEREPDGLVARWVTSAGDSLRLEMRARSISGDTVGRNGFVGTLTDVTRRTQVEDVRQANHRTLDTLINNLPGMVYRCRNNPDWTMEFVSHGALELTGCQPEELLNNRRISYAQLIVEADRHQVWDTVQTCLREHRPFELVYRIRTAQGFEKWVLERGQGNFSTSGELLGLEGFITDITDEKRAELRLQRNSLYEAVTDLPTPPLFMDRLERALLRSRQDPSAEFALLRLYLDHFARIRGNYGAEFGDRVALEITRRFQDVLSDMDTLSRWHEDEFIAIVYPSDRIAAIAQHLQGALRAPIIDRETEIFVTASVGITLSSGGHENVEAMLHDAGVAMARAKEMGGARCEVADRG